MRVRLVIWLALMLAVAGMARAQSTLLGFPPGMFSNRAALSGPSACTPNPCMGDVWPGWSYFFSISACYQFIYSGSVEDITDSATGNTTGTRRVCNNGVVGDLSSASACTFVTGNACSSLATTCAVACNIRTLYDQSGGGFNVVQATNANRPVYTQSCQNGLACATCTRASSQGWISTSGPTVTIDATGNVFYILLNIASTPGTEVLISQTGEVMSYGAGTIAKTSINAGGPGQTQSATMTVGTTYGILAQLFSTTSGGTSQTSLNGSTTGDTTANNVGNTSASGTIGICNANTGVLFMDGKFMEGGLIKNPTGFSFSAMNATTHAIWNN